MIKLLQVGLGPLGRMIVRDVHDRGVAEVVAAVDTSPGIAGRPLREIVSNAARNVDVDASLDAVGAPYDAAIVATASSLPQCAPTFRRLLDRGVAVVSSCEELVYPRLHHAELAGELDALAKARGGRLLGTGINPGFIMDTLPVIASAVCREVRAVEVERIQDASPRRVPFQVKIGATLDAASFQRKAESGSLRHVGLGESLHFIAGAFGFAIDRWHETLDPVIADETLRCGLGEVVRGCAAGVRQVAEGFVGDRRIVRLVFQAAIGQPDPRDRVVLDADPPVDLTIRGGVHGDTGTVAILFNAVRSLLAAPPGLHTMLSVPPVWWRAPGGAIPHAG